MAHTNNMPRWCRTAYLVVMVAVATPYFASPDPLRLLGTLIGCSSIAAMVARVPVNRPRHALTDRIAALLVADLDLARLALIP